ncbi:MAG: undecaprenyl-diphosphate phosphatase [Sphingomicrobium sp.]
MPILLLVIILGIVEGVTEFLPVSSTGHLILATELLGFDAAKWALFNIAIQPGAILAIVVLYWRTFWNVLVGLFHRSPSAFAFVRNLFIAFVPAVVLGLALGDYIETLLGNAWVVAVALIVGGIAILIVEKFARPREQAGGVAGLSLKQSGLIGLVQCLAMVPGVSRSGATILGAMSFGVDRKTAAEFSFFLAVPTLAGATALQLFKHRAEITSDQLAWIGIGSLVSFVVAVIVVKAFISIITRFGFAPFAWYRIAAGAAALVWLGMR